jgi:TPP-dependent pyruvate/acetoin dehydrogenase alpha subunit
MTRSTWPNRDKNEVSTLGVLGDPEQMNGPLDLKGYSSNQLISALYDMSLIRVVEEVIAEMVVSGDVKCPAHLTIGQEAASVGIAAHLRQSDRAFGCHRSHGHYLAMGGSMQGIMDEVLGKGTGCSKGMGGSMHLTAKEVGFYGSVPIVAGTVPLAVGAGLAAKKDGNGDIGIAFFGDGACEEGVVHESLNAASTLDIPVLFVVENNLFSSHMDIHLRQPTDRTARFAEANGVTSVTLDGNDVVQMMNVVGELIKDMRENPKPVFVEAITYRWRGHVGPNEDIDVGLRRSTTELNAWKGRDPIRRLVDALIAEGHYSQNEFEAMQTKIRKDVDIARDAAYAAPYPNEELLLEAVYAKR